MYLTWALWGSRCVCVGGRLDYCLSEGGLDSLYKGAELPFYKKVKFNKGVRPLYMQGLR